MRLMADRNSNRKISNVGIQFELLHPSVGHHNQFQSQGIHEKQAQGSTKRH
jgi:hypothetical protein